MPSQNETDMNRKAPTYPWQERQLDDGTVCCTVKTLGVISIAHDGLAAAQACSKTNPRRARRLNNLAETLLAAAAVILRYEEAMVPFPVLDAIAELSNELREPAVRRRRRGQA